MSALPLVPTVFATGAKDIVAAADAYASKLTSNPINSIQSLSQKIGFDVGSILGNAQNAMALGSVIKMAMGGKIEFDKNILTARLLASSSKILSSYRALDEGLKGGMTSLMNVGESLTTSINGVASMVDSAKIDSIKSLGNFLSDYTGNKNLFSIVDTGAVGSMIGGLVTEASNLGIKNVFSSLTSGIEDLSLLTKTAQNAIPKLLSNGDLTSLLEIATSPIAKNLGPLYPLFGNDLAAAFGTKINRELKDSLEDFQKYTRTMDGVFKDWDKFSGNGDDFGVNILRMMGSSKSFQDMIIDGVRSLDDDRDRKKNYLLHGLYKETTVEAEIKRFFPKTALISKSSPKAIKKKNSVDPRTIMKIGSAALLVATA